MISKKPNISVIIATRNRSEKLKQCIDSITNGTYNNYEIIIVDQSDTPKTHKLVKKYHQKNKFIYIKLKKPGKAKALIVAFNKARGSIVSYTDDDCIAKKNWLWEINKYFQTHKECTGVFGKVLPFKPELHQTKICPATFIGKSEYTTSDRKTIHYLKLGQGNNMSFRKIILSDLRVGPQKTWLGPGNFIMKGGEESEHIYRLLSLGYQLSFSPNIVVYHNKWLTAIEESLLQGGYTCGLMAFYIYYIFDDFFVMCFFVSSRIKERLAPNIKNVTKNILKLKFNKIASNKHEILTIGWQMVCVLVGLFIGLYHLLKDKILFNKSKFRST
ncbi:glycosyltransferase [Patescibacteria group bacterium]